LTIHGRAKAGTRAAEQHFATLDFDDTFLAAQLAGPWRLVSARSATHHGQRGADVEWGEGGVLRGGAGGTMSSFEWAWGRRR
jgi:hypothetical protein